VRCLLWKKDPAANEFLEEEEAMPSQELMIYGGAALGVFFIGLIATIAARYRKVSPNEALVISGGRHGVRIVTGGGTFVWPVIETAQKMALDVMTIEVKTPPVYTGRGVPVQVDGIAQIKIDSSNEVLLRTASELFLSKTRDEVMDVALLTVEGHLRAILGAMDVEDIYKNRDVFAQKVQEVSATDLKNMGLRIVSFTLRDIKDAQGYLDALGKPRLAEVQREATVKQAQATSEAQIAQAEANRNAAIKSADAKRQGEVARILSETGIAEANRDYQFKQAEYLETVNQRKAAADRAYDLQKYKTDQLVKKEEVQISVIEKEQQIKVQEMEIARKAKELDATVQKPADARKYAIQAEAEAERFKISAEAQGRAEAQKSQGLAQADVIRATGAAEAEAIKLRGGAEADVIRAKGLAEAESMRKKAESYSQYNAAAVTEMFVTMLPELAKAVSAPLAKMDKLVVVNNGGQGPGTGAAKVTQDVAAVMAQLPPVVEALSGVSLRDLLSHVPGLTPARPAAGHDSKAAPTASQTTVSVPPPSPKGKA
jgi:flotillin